MRSLTVVALLVSGSLLLMPACHEDWSVLGHELEVTFDELGGALAGCDTSGHEHHGHAEHVQRDVRRLAGSVEAWSRSIEHDLEAWAASVESDAEVLGRRLEVSAEEMGQGLESSLERLGWRIEQGVERFGRALERAMDDFARWLSTLD